MEWNRVHRIWSNIYPHRAQEHAIRLKLRDYIVFHLSLLFQPLRDVIPFLEQRFMFVDKQSLFVLSMQIALSVSIKFNEFIFSNVIVNKGIINI